VLALEALRLSTDGETERFAEPDPGTLNVTESDTDVAPLALKVTFPL
jgi:hypothetical protein